MKTKKVKKEKKVATIIDTQVAWKNLKQLHGESFLMKTNPPYHGCEYIIENNLAGDITVLESTPKGIIKDWRILSKEFIEDEGYEIV